VFDEIVVNPILPIELCKVRFVSEIHNGHHQKARLARLQSNSENLIGDQFRNVEIAKDVFHRPTMIGKITEKIEKKIILQRAERYTSYTFRLG
jgi:transcription antitermination factor NusA-like protein